MAVHRSARNLYVQVVDDTQARTLFSFSTRDRDFLSVKPEKGKTSAAEKLGEVYASRLKEKGIQKLVFDRGGYPYHGRVRALAESLRKAGLEF